MGMGSSGEKTISTCLEASSKGSFGDGASIDSYPLPHLHEVRGGEEADTQGGFPLWKRGGGKIPKDRVDEGACGPLSLGTSKMDGG